MKRKYKNIKELARAFKCGELSKKEWTLILDNDCSSLRYTGALPDGMDEDSEEADVWLDKKNDEADKLFYGNGYSDLQDACEAAGIPTEWC